MRCLVVLTLLLGCAVSVSAQPDPCTLFTKDDVAAVLGAAPSADGHQILPGTCTWGATGITLTVSRTAVDTADSAGQMLDLARTNAAPGEQIKDEAGLGDRAVSRVDRYSRSVELQVAAGNRFWRFMVETADQKIPADATLTALRKLAGKAIAAG
jgi:hypothetical protein